jgi:membrane protease YdiL (CAAX protease family)
MPILDALPADAAAPAGAAAGEPRPDDMRPPGDSPVALPNESDREQEPVARPPRRPRPGFWEAAGWSFLYGLVLQVVVIVGATLVAIAWRAVQYPNPSEYFGQFKQQGFAESTEYRWLERTAQVLFMVAYPVLGAAFGYVMIRATSGRQWRRRLALRWPAMTHVVLAVLGLPALVVLSDGVYKLAVLARLPSFHYQAQLDRLLEGIPWGLAVLVIGLGPAFSEELWCRGFLGRGLVGRYGYVGGVLLSSFLFGILHLDPPHVVATFAMGIMLHLAYLATRSLWIPMLLHFLNNSLGALSATLCKGTVVSAVIEERGPAVYVASAILALAVGLALVRSRARLVSAPEDAWQPDGPGVEFPPAWSDTRVVRPAAGWSSWACVAAAVVLFSATILLPLWPGSSDEAIARGRSASALHATHSAAAR